jgi:DNA-binding GntR family transcriptional regulator
VFSEDSDIYTSIKTAVFRGEFSAERSIPIEKTARNLGCSPIPLREVLVRLASEDVLDHHKSIGFFPKRLSSDHVLTAYATLFDLIECALRQKGMVTGGQNKHRLKLLIEQDAEFGGKLRSCPDFYEKVLQTLVASVTSGPVKDVVHQLTQRTAMFRYKTFAIRSDFDESERAFRAIADCVAAQDEEHAVSLLRSFQALRFSNLGREFAHYQQ